MIVRVDKVASSTATLKLGKEIEISDRIEVRAGNVIVVKALQEKSVYDKLELDTGRMAHIGREDVIAGVLGKRRALKGFVGDLPETIAVGDRLQILNLGGVIGVCVSGNKDLGTPLQVEVLGMAVRDGRPLNIEEGAIPPRASLAGIPDFPPLVIVEGTCMAAGKTQAACEIIQKLAQRGWRCAALKATGVACMRDLLNMIDHGARDGPRRVPASRCVSSRTATAISNSASSPTTARSHSRSELVSSSSDTDGGKPRTELVESVNSTAASASI